jgi:hypothetical protein
MGTDGKAAGGDGGGRLAASQSARRAVPATITTGLKGPYKPSIPKVWDDASMEKLELPRASKVEIHELPSEYYYRIPERTIWKTYPIYAPGKEPAGYWKWLQHQEPKKAVEWDKLHTKADWIRVGSLVFDSGANYSDPVKDFLPIRDPDCVALPAISYREPDDCRGVPKWYGQHHPAFAAALQQVEKDSNISRNVI